MRVAASITVSLLALPAFADSVAVLSQPVMRGDILSAADFTDAELPLARARGALMPEEAAGYEAKRNLAAGRIVRSSDVTEPRLVRRGDRIAILVQSDTLTITARGEALEEGAEGETIRVVTDASRTLEGRVAADGSVRVPLL